MARVHFIGCGVLRLDLEAAAKALNIDVVSDFLEGGLHDDPAELRLQLQAAIDAISQQADCTRIVLGYGVCGRGLIGIRARNVPLVVPKVHDCISIFLGSNKAYQEQFKRHPGTYYVSAGWFEEKVQPVGKRKKKAKDRSPLPRPERDRLEEKYGADNARHICEFLSSWQRNYKRAAFIDTGTGKRDKYETHAQTMADEFGWNYEAIQGDQSVLQRALTVDGETEDILWVPPGHIILHDPLNNSILASPEHEDTGLDVDDRSFLDGVLDPAAASTPKRRARLGLGIDAGGTYTDAVLFDLQKKTVLATGKALTTKWDYTVGIAGAIEAMKQSHLGEVDLVAVSTTLATNAIVEGYGQDVGLILMPPNQQKSELDHKPTITVKGRMNIDGEELEPIDPNEIRHVARQMLDKDGVRAFAVSGYASTRNRQHEQQIKTIIRELADVGVVCGHELSDQLNFFVRANTAVLNARIVPLLEGFLHDVNDCLQKHGVNAPVAVVKGDGSLMSTMIAVERPIETVMSGPAASVAGARYLTAVDDATVLDMGGTTSDIARLDRGRVSICADGASVGGWHTHVRALDMRTVGLGGDSRILLYQHELSVGPQRIAPISSLAAQHGSLDKQLRFLEQRLDDYKSDSTPMEFLVATGKPPTFTPTENETRILDALKKGPCSLAQLALKAGIPHWMLVQTKRLEDQFTVQRCGLTPTDILHTQGLLDIGDNAAATTMLRLFAEIKQCSTKKVQQEIHDLIARQLMVELLKKQLPTGIESGEPDPDPAFQSLMDNLFHGGDNGYRLSIELRHPLIGLGAPVSYFLPRVAGLLNGDLEIPEHAAVANAVGAITSRVTVAARAVIRADGMDGFVVEGADSQSSFDELHDASRFAAEQLRDRLFAEAEKAGTSSRDLQFNVDTRITRTAEGINVFLDRTITAEITGSPDLIVS